MAYTVEEKIKIAKICQYLAARDVRNGSLFGATLNPVLPQILYIERKSVEWGFDKNPDDPILVGVSNYLYSLCNNCLEAAQISNLGGGGVVVDPNNPNNDNAPYLIPVYPGDFASATAYNNPYIAGENLQIFANFIPKYLDNPDEYVTTVDGINITIDGFDAAVFDPNKVLLNIYIVKNV